MKKQFVVIGMGRFGKGIAKTLAELDAEVLVIDENEERINYASTFATHAVQMDATDEQALQSLGIGNFDVVCVCISEVQSSIMITMLCKEYGVKQVVAKAGSVLHAKVLERMGADQVIFPENDMGMRMAHKLVSTNILDFIELSEDFGIAEFEVYEDWIGASLTQLDFRKKYGLNIIAIRSASQEINVNPLPNDILKKDDVIIVIGSEMQIGKLEKLANKKN